MLKEKGVAIIFVTHKLAEIMEMTDCLTVMRDGKNVGSYTRDEYDQNKIVEDMIGRKLTVMYPERACSIGEEPVSYTHLYQPVLMNARCCQLRSRSIRRMASAMD